MPYLHFTFPLLSPETSSVSLLWGVFHALSSYLRKSSPDHCIDPFGRLRLFSIAFEVKIEILSVAQKTVCNLILSCLCCSFSPPVFKLQHPLHHHSTPAHYSNRNEAFVIMAREGSQTSLTSAFLGTLAGHGRSPGALFTEGPNDCERNKRREKEVLAPILIPETLAFKAIPI